MCRPQASLSSSLTAGSIVLHLTLLLSSHSLALPTPTPGESLLGRPTIDSATPEEPRTAYLKDDRARFLHTPIPSPLSPALFSAFLSETQVTASRSPYTEVTDTGDAVLSPLAMVAPCWPAFKFISSFPSEIPGMNNGQGESWIRSALMAVPKTP